MNPHNIAAIFLAAVAVGMCIPSWLDRWATRNVNRMVDDGRAALAAEDIAADTWARHRAQRDAYDWQRDLCAAVDFGFVEPDPFVETAAQIRALPEIEENR